MHSPTAPRSIMKRRATTGIHSGSASVTRAWKRIAEYRAWMSSVALIGGAVADECDAGRREDRLVIRGQAYEADVRRHSPTLEEHGKKLDTLVSELGAKAKNALDSYRHVQRLAREVIEKYQKQEKTLPMPFVKR